MREASPKEMQRIHDLIADIEVAMLTTLAGAWPRSRPMRTMLERDEPVVWMVISRESDTAAELQRQPRVSLAYADPDRERYVALAGEAAVITDRESVRRHWRDEFGKWFPNPDSPEVALVRVAIAQAEYWDDSAQLMRNFFETIAAPFSGIPPEAVGEHARVRPN